MNFEGGRRRKFEVCLAVQFWRAVDICTVYHGGRMFVARACRRWLCQLLILHPLVNFLFSVSILAVNIHHCGYFPGTGSRRPIRLIRRTWQCRCHCVCYYGCGVAVSGFPLVMFLGQRSPRWICAALYPFHPALYLVFISSYTFETW